jgi:hypothetical protein
MSSTEQRPIPGGPTTPDDRPEYEPPRLAKRRSLARVTGQITGNTPGGTSSSPPPVTGNG